MHIHHFSEKEKFGIHFFSGGFGLATAFAMMHPLDTLKTQLQTNSVNLRGLGKGFFVSFLLAAPQGGLRLSSYEYCKSWFLRNYPEMGVPTSSAIAACVGDTVSSVVKVPREVITARLQSGMDADLIKRSSSPALSTLKLVVKEQGIKGLYRGFWSTSARDWPFMIILFTTYESFKQNHHLFNTNFYSKKKDLDDDFDDTTTITTLKSTIFGGISGGLAGFMTTPFDVIKTNIMTHKGQGNLSIASVATKLWTRGGPRKFFVGGSARSVWWFCVCSAFFPLYETSKETIKNFYRSDSKKIIKPMPSAANASQN